MQHTLPGIYEVIDEGVNLITGDDNGENLLGGSSRDIIDGGNGDDRIEGLANNDLLIGRDGADQIFGGTGNDVLLGGAGDDILEGGPGADFFVIDPANLNEGADTILDFNSEDTLVINLSGRLNSVPLASLDQSTAFNITESDEGFVTIQHLNGSVELQGLNFSDETDSFAELSDFIIVTSQPAGSQILIGTDDLEENITGADGNDLLFGGVGPDNFIFLPNNEQEGNDVIGDFNLQQDSIVFNQADLLAVEPNLATAADNGNDELDLADLDASGIFFIFQTENNFLGIAHPNGTIELAGVEFTTDRDSFTELEDIIEIQNVIEQPTDVQNAINGFITETTPDSDGAGEGDVVDQNLFDPISDSETETGTASIGTNGNSFGAADSDPETFDFGAGTTAGTSTTPTGSVPTLMSTGPTAGFGSGIGFDSNIDTLSTIGTPVI